MLAYSLPDRHNNDRPHCRARVVQPVNSLPVSKSQPGEHLVKHAVILVDKHPQQGNNYHRGHDRQEIDSTEEYRAAHLLIDEHCQEKP